MSPASSSSFVEAIVVAAHKLNYVGIYADGQWCLIVFVSVKLITFNVSRVCTDPGKVRKVVEFSVEILPALKSRGKWPQVWKSLKNPWKLWGWSEKSGFLLCRRFIRHLFAAFLALSGICLLRFLHFIKSKELSFSKFWVPIVFQKCTTRLFCADCQHCLQSKKFWH